MNKTNLTFFKKTFKNMLANAALEGGTTLYELGKGDSIDQSLNERDCHLSMRLKGRNFIYLKKVKEALLRIEDGHFGSCEECGDEIETRRLIARPTATKCLCCKEEEENGSKKMIHKNRYSLKNTNHISVIA